jgi:hypothetical protein
MGSSHDHRVLPRVDRVCAWTMASLTLARLRELRREGMVAPSEVDHAEAEPQNDEVLLEEAASSWSTRWSGDGGLVHLSS